MKNRLQRQSRFTRWAAIGTGGSAAAGMLAVAVLIIVIIAAYVVGQRTTAGVVYPPVLDAIGIAALFVMGLSLAGFLVCAAGLVAGLVAGKKPNPEESGQ